MGFSNIKSKFPIFKQKINGKEIILWMNGSLIDKKNDPYKGKEIGSACGWKLKGAWHKEWHKCILNDFPTYLREKRTIDIIKVDRAKLSMCIKSSEKRKKQKKKKTIDEGM